MKRLITVSVENEVYERLHAKAHEMHTSASALANELLCSGLDVVKPAQVRKLSKNEQAVLHALDMLIADHVDETAHHLRGRKFFHAKKIARKAGLYPGEALKCLAALTREGILYEYEAQSCDAITKHLKEGLAWEQLPYVEHWGFPPTMLRKKKEEAPEGAQ